MAKERHTRRGCRGARTNPNVMAATQTLFSYRSEDRPAAVAALVEVRRYAYLIFNWNRVRPASRRL